MEMTRCYIVLADDLSADAWGPEVARARLEWSVFFRTGVVCPPPVGNWHFGSLLHAVFNSISTEFPESARAHLEWSSYPNPVESSFIILAVHRWDNPAPLKGR